MTSGEPGEIYVYVPDTSWGRWPDVTRALYDKLRRPMTTEEVLAWSQGASFDVGGGRMGVARRVSYARNMLAWLSQRGEVDFSRGKWRRTLPTLPGK